ncbi:hypothetical protein BGE01nite_57030 [Brevifollis gellanilyticus]|uniref:Uncharacterized protein n=1 Tax=Brevifollis gellanilyticus TaxID=748831 RepID=A0A512MI53_9BACT|nr:hypothetical protein BGE01nite_57030 [Brevifollis gellanilyticus]
MRAADIPKSMDHGQDDEAEGEGDASMTDAALGGGIDDDGAGAREDEGEGAEEFREELFHDGDEE